MATMVETHEVPCYRDASAATARRVADLLSRMTVEEKAAQMTCIWRKKDELLLDESGCFDPEKAHRNFGHGRGIGQIGRISDAGGGAD